MNRSDSILYKRWYQFVIGTTQPHSYAWAQYGAKGIKMKKSWTVFKSGFDQFEHAFDLGSLMFQSVWERFMGSKGSFSFPDR